MKMLDRLNLGLRKGAKPAILDQLIKQPDTPRTARQISELIPYSVSTVCRALDDLTLGRFVEHDNGRPRRFWLSHEQASRWRSMLGADD